MAITSSSCSVSGGTGLQIFHEEDGSPDLFSLCRGDLGGKVLSYASASDLCKFDTLNKQFRGLTADAWEEIASERYGMKNGKEGWRMGTSLLRKPVYIHINKAPGHDDMWYAGCPTVTAHNSLVAVIRDDENGEGAPHGIGTYNAESLAYIGPRGNEGGGSNIAIAGPASAEVFVTNRSHSLEFLRGDVVQRQHFPHNRNPDGIPVLGSDTHVIAAIGNTLCLYKVTSASTIVTLCQSFILGRGCRVNNDYFKNCIAWGGDHFEVVVYHSLQNSDDAVPGRYGINVLRLDIESNSLFRAQMIDADVELMGVALSEDFIVGASVDKKIHVWDRHRDEKKSYVLCDVREEEQLEEEMDLLYPVHMSFRGHMLVATSHLGCALCIWNIKTGQLLKRYNDAAEDRRVTLLPDGCDVVSMAYLKHLNGYVCASGFLNVWTFPTDQSQKDMAEIIREREQYLRASAGEW